MDDEDSGDGEVKLDPIDDGQGDDQSRDELPDTKYNEEPVSVVEEGFPDGFVEINPSSSDDEDDSEVDDLLDDELESELKRVWQACDSTERTVPKFNIADDFLLATMQKEVPRVIRRVTNMISAFDESLPLHAKLFQVYQLYSCGYAAVHLFLRYSIREISSSRIMVSSR